MRKGVARTFKEMMCAMERARRHTMADRRERDAFGVSGEINHLNSLRSLQRPIPEAHYGRERGATIAPAYIGEDNRVPIVLIVKDSTTDSMQEFPYSTTKSRMR